MVASCLWQSRTRTFLKDTNYNTEMLSTILTKLKQHGLQISKVHLHIQLDNTSQGNKNNVMFRYLAFLVSSMTIQTTETAFLRKGHTHEDIDQLFGRLAAWIVKHHVIETPQQFATVIRNFLATLHGRPWPARPCREAIIVNSVRGWKAWLEVLGMALQETYR